MRNGMSQPIFLRKADLAPAARKSLKHKDIESHLPLLIKDIFATSDVSLKEDKRATLHFIYHVDCQGEEWILKIAKFHCLRHSLLLEKHMYSAILAGSEISLEIRHLDISCTTYPFAFLVMQQAPGLCLRDIPMNSPNFSNIIRGLGRAVADYHQRSPTAYGFGLIEAETLATRGVLQGAYESWGTYLYANLDNHLHYAEKRGALSSRDAKIVRSLFEKHEPLIVSCSRARLLHGDLGMHNVFIDPDTLKVTAIIDWEDVLLGDPLFDIAMFASFFRMDEFIKQFCEGYSHRESSSRDKALDVTFWLYYIRIVVAKAVLRFKLGYDASGHSRSTPKIRLALANLRTYI